MQHLSPARLRAPLRRTGPRGSGEFKEITWDEALGIADQLARAGPREAPREARLLHRPRPVASPSPAGGRSSSAPRTTPPTAASARSTWPRPASTPSAAPSGSSARPDWERTELFLLFGVAEDHDCNPIKIGLGKLKARGARVVSINPVRTGYNAIADQWLGITPGTDGLLVLSLVHVLMAAGKIDLDYLAALHQRRAARRPGPALARLRHCSCATTRGRELVWDRARHRAVPWDDRRR